MASAVKDSTEADAQLRATVAVRKQLSAGHADPIPLIQQAGAAATDMQDCACA